MNKIKRLLVVTLADPSISNGQGIFAKSIIKSLAEKSQDGLKIFFVTPKFSNKLFLKK